MQVVSWVMKLEFQNPEPEHSSPFYSAQGYHKTFFPRNKRAKQGHLFGFIRERRNKKQKLHFEYKIMIKRRQRRKICYRFVKNVVYDVT